MVVEGEFQAIKTLLVRYFSTRRFVGQGTKEKKRVMEFFSLEVWKINLPCLPNERPFVVEISAGLPFWLVVTKREKNFCNLI